MDAPHKDDIFLSYARAAIMSIACRPYRRLVFIRLATAVAIRMFVDEVSWATAVSEILLAETMLLTVCDLINEAVGFYESENFDEEVEYEIFDDDIECNSRHCCEDSNACEEASVERPPKRRRRLTNSGKRSTRRRSISKDHACPFCDEK